MRDASVLNSYFVSAMRVFCDLIMIKISSLLIFAFAILISGAAAWVFHPYLLEWSVSTTSHSVSPEKNFQGRVDFSTYFGVYGGCIFFAVLLQGRCTRQRLVATLLAITISFAALALAVMLKMISAREEENSPLLVDTLAYEEVLFVPIGILVVYIVARTLYKQNRGRAARRIV